MKLKNLQILRGISALLVCFFHFRENLNIPDLELGEILFSKGSIGVPIFFVISGFIMVFTTRTIDFTETNVGKEIVIFFKKRIIRVVPLYYLLTFAWIFIGGSFFYYFEGKGFSRLLHSLLFLPEKNVFPVVYLGWSLNYEMFFYLVFGISLFFKTKRYFFIITFFIVTYLLGLIFNPENAYLEMVTSYLNLYFVVGIIYGLLLDKIPVSKNIGIIISSTGILLFTLLIFKIIPAYKEILTLFIVSLFVLSFLLFDYTFHCKGNRFLVFLGDISYSLYLSHPFVGVLLKRFHVEGYLSIPYFAVQIALVILVATFLYHFIEKRMINYLKLKSII